MVPEIWSLEYLATTSGTRSIPTATVVLRRGEETRQDSATGDGPVDAAYHAVDRITGVSGTLVSYQIRAVTSGKDALGEASIKVLFDGGREILRAGGVDGHRRGLGAGLRLGGEQDAGDAGGTGEAGVGPAVTRPAPCRRAASRNQQRTTTTVSARSNQGRE